MFRRGLKILLLLVLAQCASAQKDTSRVLEAFDTAWNSDPSFSYMKNIDSLLHVMNNRNSRAKTMVMRSRSSSESDDQGFLKIFQNPTIRVIFWIGVAIFFGYILYVLLFRFGLLDKSKAEPEAVHRIEGKDLDTYDNYTKAIREAEETGKYKLSVRYLFLSMLSFLQSKQILEFIPEKTNENYIREVSEWDIAPDFKRLTHIYEYFWYGNNIIGENDYRAIKSQFENLFNSLSH